MTFLINAGELDRRVRFEANSAAKTFMGGGKKAWALHDEVWAKITDLATIVGDTDGDDGKVSRRQSRVLVRYRTDIQPGMRVIIDPAEPSERICTIIGEPIEKGSRQGTELLVQSFSTQGEQP